MDYYSEGTKIVSIRELAVFLAAPKDRIAAALKRYAFETAPDGSPGVSSYILVRLLERAESLDPAPNEPVVRANGSTRRHFSKELRERILDRDGRKCRYCGKIARDHLQVDHLIPVSMGGTDDEVNLVAACSVCNRRKRHHIADDIGMKLRRRTGLGTVFNRRQQQLARGNLFALDATDD